ncbi:MAG: DegT/DnrJ/EryC1/StrS aminotransferase family protein [Opitutus sp.]
MSFRPDYLPFGRPDFTDEEIDAVARVMRSGWIGMGPETQAFEQELAAAVGAPHVVTVNSCTSALFLALLAQGIGAGDDVICPSLTWCSTANAVLYAGANPVFCDVDPDTFCVTPSTVLRALTPRTKAVMVVHFGGLAVDTRSLREALPRSVAIIEDAAHAFGARFPDDSPVGSSGNATCFSFYANKNLSTGEGGAVALFDSAQADRIRSLRQHALPVDAWKRFTHSTTIMLTQQLSELGYKANYTDLQAAIGRVQLRRSSAMATKRRHLADAYLEHVAGAGSPLHPQDGVVSTRHALHLFTVRVGASALTPRDALLLELRRRNIGATIHYTVLHLMPLYLRGKPPVSLPVTEAIGRDILTLPTSASMSQADIEYVCHHVRELTGLS